MLYTPRSVYGLSKLLDEVMLRKYAARHAGLRAYALVPRRMEVLRGGPQWPDGPIRFEWARTASSTDRAPESRSSAAGLVWSTPRQILPYSWPGHA